jgi:signal transduction histidine kinase
MITRRPLADLALAGSAALVVAWAVTGSSDEWRLRVTLLALPLGAALVMARRWPIPAVGLSLAALFLSDGAGTEVESAFLLAVVISCFVAGRFARPAQLPWVGAGVLLMVSTTLLSPEGGSLADAVFPVLLTAGPCLLGLAIQLALLREGDVREQARLLDTMRDEEVRRAAAEERLRIARDLHDLVAHDISALSLQAQLARRDAEAGRPVEPATLLRIERTAQQAMSDARRLLGLLRQYDDLGARPSQGVEDLDALLESVRSIGQRVELQQCGPARPLAPALSRAVYRIVQESLTNARRHGASGSTTTVQLDWTRSDLSLLVTNPVVAQEFTTPGHGIAGITQRAEMFGGTARIGADRDRWKVAVRLPLPEGVGL